MAGTIISPERIGQLFLRFSSDQDFRAKFQSEAQQNRDFRKVKFQSLFKTPSSEFYGSVSPYFYAVQIVLHDPRAQDLYDQYYTRLADPEVFQYVCYSLARKEQIMAELNKGIMFNAAEQTQLQQIDPKIPVEVQEQKAEEVLKKVVEKKVEVKKEDHKSSLPSGGPKKKEPAAKKEEPKKAETAPVTALPNPVDAKPVVAPVENIPLVNATPVNSTGFKFKQAAAVVSPTISNVGKRLSHAAFLFYRRHPISARAAIGGSIGAVVSTVSGWPFGPLSGAVAGVFVSAAVPRVFEIISPPAQSEPDSADGEEFEDPEMNEWANSLPSGSSGFEPAEYERGGQGGQGGRSLPGRNLVNRARGLRNAAQMAGNIRKAASIARAAPLLANPYVLIGLAVIGGILLLVVLFIFLFVVLPTGSLLNPLGDEVSNQTSTNPNVKLIKSGPAQVENGAKIGYSITISNTGSAAVSAEISDKVPDGTLYLTSNPPAVVEGTTLKWEISNLAGGQSQTVTFEVITTKTDFWAINEAIGKVLSKINFPGNVSEAEGEQDKLVAETVKGQQRNVQILGDENSFVQTVITNGASEGMAQREQYLRQIYQAAAANNLNPLIILATWGTETGFRLDLVNVALSCPVHVSTSFSQQADCSAKTFTRWMDVFDQKNEGGKLGIDEVADSAGRIKTGKVCMYYDSLLYSMEWYGPLCHYKDQNENYRPNFVKFYKKFGGF